MGDAAVFWLGPVNLMQVDGATVPGARTVNLTCTGDGSGGTPVCSGRMESKHAGGRYLPQIIPNLSPTTDVFIGAFSAGGKPVKEMLLASPEDRAQIRAVMLSDATYAPWVGNKPEAHEGLVLYALQAIDGPYMFVATASASPNKDLPTGSQVIEALRQEIEARSGRSFEPYQAPGVSPTPAKGWKLGNVYLFDHQMDVLHGDHAKVLARQYWQNLLLPWLAGADYATPWLPILALVAASAVGFWGMRKALKS